MGLLCGNDPINETDASGLWAIIYFNNGSYAVAKNSIAFEVALNIAAPNSITDIEIHGDALNFIQTFSTGPDGEDGSTGSIKAADDGNAYIINADGSIVPLSQFADRLTSDATVNLSGCYSSNVAQDVSKSLNTFASGAEGFTRDYADMQDPSTDFGFVVTWNYYGLYDEGFSFYRNGQYLVILRIGIRIMNYGWTPYIAMLCIASFLLCFEYDEWHYRSIPPVLATLNTPIHAIPGLDRAFEIGVALKNYALAHNGHYPWGKTSTEIFQSLLSNSYLVKADPLFFEFPGKEKSTGNQLTSRNVCYDITSNMTINSPNTVPLYFSTGFKVNYREGTAIVKSGLKVRGMIVGYKDYVEFIPVVNGNNIIFAKPSSDVDVTYTQLCP